jgi:molecular chaperone GrpE
MDNSKEKNNIDPETTPKTHPTHPETGGEETDVDDIELENDAEFSSSMNKDVVTRLRQKLKKSDEEKREYLLGWQKMKADYINSRKQDEEEKKAVIKFAESDLISEIIPVLDSFEMALGGQGQTAAGAGAVSEEWRRGIEQIRNQLHSILSDHGLKVLNPAPGSHFSPHEAEAVGVSETDDASKDDTVATVFQKGYKLHDRVIRPAKVKVWKHN